MLADKERYWAEGTEVVSQVDSTSPSRGRELDEEG